MPVPGQAPESGRSAYQPMGTTPHSVYRVIERLSVWETNGFNAQRDAWHRKVGLRASFLGSYRARYSALTIVHTLAESVAASLRSLQ